ncbi:MAG: 2-hydroxyacyl-CoA dehydratase [Oscillospiraceae bacterium]|nr:2-hydroxyacyl-CoA dehydratase [Oscillospiraceae bacterium]
MNNYYIPFTEEMKKTHTILVPNMLPLHFQLIMEVLRTEGYKLDLLTAQGPQVRETGLKYVHNDTCYPAILVIGQFLQALQSGRYDPHKVALILFQTGGGCRASNYISLLRKALEKAGYGYVPVISLSLTGIEHHPGFQLSLSTWHRIIYAALYGDLLLSLVNQVKPYELHRGDAEALAERFAKELAEEKVSFRRAKQRYRDILDAFAAIPMERTQKVQVGIVGEIYVKFSPLGNNNLEQMLVDQGAEVTIPGLLDFAIYCVYNMVLDYQLYHRGRLTYPAAKFAYRFITKKKRQLIALIEEHGVFKAPTPFEHTVELIQDHIGMGCKMGEGWLLPAEMLELADSGVENIVCTQPFGCLPNHIVGKGMMKPLKEANPRMNIVAIDYDASASHVNQENRIKLMLSNARKNLEEKVPV